MKGVFALFQKHDVKYLVIGGKSVALYGVPRVTFDLEILIKPTRENARSLFAALLDAGLGTASLTSEEEILSNEISIFEDRLRIDVQITTPGILFEEVW